MRKGNHMKCKIKGTVLSCSTYWNLSLNKGIRKKNKKTHCVRRINAHADTPTNKSKEVLNPGHCGVLNTGLLCFDAADAHMVFH